MDVAVEFWLQAITAINEITNDFEVRLMKLYSQTIAFIFLHRKHCHLKAISRGMFMFECCTLQGYLLMFVAYLIHQCSSFSDLNRRD